MIRMNPYLNFAGNAREAMEYYQEIFGGHLHVNSFGEFGVPGMPADGTMHAALTTDHFTLMASDAMPGAEATWGGTRNYVGLFGDDADTMQRWHAALAADGTVGMPLEQQVWGDLYGDVRDKFGIEWMFNIAQPGGEALDEAPQG